MRRLEFNKEEFSILCRLIEAAPSTAGMILGEAADLLGLIKFCIEDLSTPYDQQQLYEVIKRKIDQRYWQVMYHTPLTAMPLKFNDEDPLLVIIAKWRLEIAK